jgi:hypothetical protein
MAIYPYPSNPNLTPKGANFNHRTLATTFSSPFTATTQTVKYTGEWIEGTLQYPPLDYTYAQELIAFFTLLRGKVNTFTWSPPPFMMATTGSMSVTITGDGSTFTGATGQVGKYSVESNTKRLIQFTSTSSIFPALPLGSNTFNSATPAQFKLMSNDVNYSVDELYLYGFAVAITDAI